MIISNVKKVKNENDIVVCLETLINGKFCHVPLDPANRHYVAILEWAKIDGNTIADAD